MKSEIWYSESGCRYDGSILTEIPGSDETMELPGNVEENLKTNALLLESVEALEKSHSKG
jgi:hypothetical protein